MKIKNEEKKRNEEQNAEQNEVWRIEGMYTRNWFV